MALIPPERCPDLTSDQARDAATAAAGWIERAQLPDDTYVYEVGPGAAPIQIYSVVRHAGVTMSLYQLAAKGDRSVLPVADRALDWMRDHVVPGEEPRLGAFGLMLAGLAHRRLATGDERHDALMRRLARYLVSQQRGDGSFVAYYGDADSRSRYYTGESFWALALVGQDRAARKAADYLATQRDEVEDLPFNPWPDQWAAYGLAEMRGRLSDEHIAYARRLAARFGFLLRSESQRREDGLISLARIGTARAAGFGTWLEGASSLWRLAGRDPRLADLRPDLADRMACGAGVLASRQRPSGGRLVRGAWFRDGVTRMDDQQHALSGLLLAQPVLP